ncbi:MAG: hypothetical protein CM15mV42_1580 [uncultured marine virus]|nr:MAG: hypothetical protein CM15mV42_1580 [uncultured marine virus]
MKIYNLIINVGSHNGLIKREHIHMKPLGTFVGTSKSWSNLILSEVSGVDVELKKPTLVEINGCTIYRFPKLSLPRNKVDLLKESANIKVTRNEEKADYKIISENLLNSLLDSSWQKFIIGKELFEVFEKQQTVFTSDAWIALNNLYKNLQDDGEDVLFRLDMNKHYSTSNPSFDKLQDAKNSIDRSGEDYHVYVEDKNQHAYDSILSSSNLVLDSHMNTLCSADLHVLTEAEANNMMKILSTTDRDNITLALEMMANCNLQKSLDFVSFYTIFILKLLRWEVTGRVLV